MSKTFTLATLREYDGRNGTIYVALNGNVFDASEKGQQFYGKGGPYEIFAGRDASRALATMNMSVKETPDDLRDLNTMQKASLEKWEAQFKEKYPVMGRLVG